MTTESLLCPICNKPQFRPTTRVRFKCWVCKSWLELDKSMTFLQDHDARVRADKESKAAWLQNEIQKRVSQYGSWEAAEEVVLKKWGMKPPRPTRPRYIFPAED